MAVVLAVGLTIAGLAIGGFGFHAGGALVPISFVALAGLAVWWFVTGERPGGGAGDVIRQAARTTRTKIGMGGVSVFDRDSGGIDVDWKDTRRAPETTPRLVVGADVGLGYVEVRHREAGRGHFGPGRVDGSSDGRNDACTTMTSSAGAATG